MFDRYDIVNDADLAATVAKRYNGTGAAEAEGSPEDSDPLGSSTALPGAVAKW